MSKFKAINARPAADCENLDTGSDVFSTDDETKADDGTSNNNANALSFHDRDVNDIDSSGIDPSDLEGDRSSQHTTDTDPATDQSADTTTTTASAAAGRAGSSATAVPIDSRCEAVAWCRAGSCDHRKTVSHIFGRNKAETRGIPEECWIKWCRKHYQRFTYRDSLAGNWHKHQLGLVREQLDRFEDRTDIQSWKIALRKKEQGKLDIENAAVAAGLLTPIAPSSALNDLSNTTGVARSAASCTTPPAANAVALGAAESTTPPTKSTSSSTETTPRSSEPPPRSGSTTSNKTNASVTSGATATVSPNTCNTTRAIPATDHSELLPTAPPDADDNPNSTTAPTPPQVWERFLVPYLGTAKTFAEVRTCCDAIEREFNTPAFQARDTYDKVFPGVEFLPIFPAAKAKKAKSKVTTSTARGTKRKAGVSGAPNKRARLVRGAKG